MCSTPQSPIYSDRFIPSRATSSWQQGFSLLDRAEAASRKAARRQAGGDRSEAYAQLLRHELFGDSSPPASHSCSAASSEDLSWSASPIKKLLRFKSGDVTGPLAGSPLPVPFESSPLGPPPPASPKAVSRKISWRPLRVLDAPKLQDDFHLNLLEYSSQNVLAVGLWNCVYLWCDHKIFKLCKLPGDNTVASVAWSQTGTHLSVGSDGGGVQIYDVNQNRMVRLMGGHKKRTAAAAWSSHLLATGSRDRSVLLHDIRAPEDFQHKLLGHCGEVCGLKWSHNDRDLASGGNDSRVHVWSPHRPAPMLTFAGHSAAVKALAWSSHNATLLATGGGSADRCIRLWNTATGGTVSCTDTGSQVCNLLWSKEVNEIVSTHGFCHNQIVLWRAPSLARLATLSGHTKRVLYLTASPDEQAIVTGAGDETLRFWKVLPGCKAQGAGKGRLKSGMARTHIR